jgi:hypothetical protein
MKTSGTRDFTTQTRTANKRLVAADAFEDCIASLEVFQTYCLLSLTISELRFLNTPHARLSFASHSLVRLEMRVT